MPEILIFQGFPAFLFASTVKDGIIILIQPKDQCGPQGSTVEFHVKASGSNLKYQWQCSYDGEDWFNTALPGYDTDTLRPVVTADNVSRKYRCIVSGNEGTVISGVAGMRRGIRIEVTEQPKDQCGPQGSTVQFHVKASGSGSLTVPPEKNNFINTLKAA